MLAMAAIFALVSGGQMVFAALGAVYISPRSFGFSYGIAEKENGFTSLSGPLANISCACFSDISWFRRASRIDWVDGIQGKSLACGFQPPTLRDVGRQESFLLEPGRQ